MDPEIIKFYKDNGYNVSDFFDKKRHCGILLSDAQVKGGIKAYYEDIQSGKIAPKRISIGWGVIARAKNARFDEFIEDNDILLKYKPMISDLHDRIGLMKEKLYTWKLCFWCILGISVFLGLAYIDIKWGLPL
ncbi:MAG: hypothetical protein MIO92_16565 [Methanosarcinaceae archaeon]|nr:hypothetical protein [Methanosarcinaceae archaeon]